MFLLTTQNDRSVRITPRLLFPFSSSSLSILPRVLYRLSLQSGPLFGLTLVEVIIALAILLIILLATFQVFGGCLRAVQYTSRRLHALSVAQSVLEAVQYQPFRSLPPEVFTVRRNQTYPWVLQLQHKNLQPQSVQISWSDGTPWESGCEIDAPSGTITLHDPHRSGTFFISYQYRVQTSSAWQSSVTGTLVSLPSSPRASPMKRIRIEVRPANPPFLQQPVVLWTVRAG